MREKEKTSHQKTQPKPVLKNLEEIKVPGDTKVSQEDCSLINIDQRLLTAEARIDRLKKQREKLQFQQALLFFKETQKIFEKAFSPDLALFVLKDAWKKSSETQKEKWQKDRGQKLQNENVSESSETGHPFRDFVASSARETDPSPDSTHCPS